MINKTNFDIYDFNFEDRVNLYNDLSSTAIHNDFEFNYSS